MLHLSQPFDSAGSPFGSNPENEECMSLATLQARIEEHLDAAQAAMRCGSRRRAAASLAIAAEAWLEYAPILTVYSGTGLRERIEMVRCEIRRRGTAVGRSSGSGEMLRKEPSRVNQYRVRRKNVPAVVPDQRLALAGRPCQAFGRRSRDQLVLAGGQEE